MRNGLLGQLLWRADEQGLVWFCKLYLLGVHGDPVIFLRMMRTK